MNKTKKINTKTTVEQLRDIRDKVSMDIKDMNFEQLKKYIDARLKMHPNADWKKSA